VWGNDLISPANTQYKVTFAPNGNITNVVSGECITGSSYSLSRPVFCPAVQVNPQQAIVRANPFATNIIPIATNVFTVGSPLALWNGFFNSVFMQSCSGPGCSSASSLLSSTNVWTGASNTFNNVVNLNGGGFLSGTFGGSPILSGSPFFSGTPVFGTAFFNTAVVDNCGVPAATGFIRVCNSHGVNWRNASNSGDISIFPNGSNRLTIISDPIVTVA